MGLFGIIVCGVATAQIVGTIQIWISNQYLHNTLVTLQAAGYFTIPTPLVSPSLTSLKASFFGGLFFALTLGSAVTMVSVAVTYIYVTRVKASNINSNPPRPQKKFRIDTVLIFTILTACYIFFNLNRNGICWIESCYFIAIPVVVVPLTYLWARGLNVKSHFHLILFPLAPVLLLTLIWTTQWEDNLFIRVRDHLLLETRMGRGINDFYYRYTLYAAEAFKPLSQKMLKTCYLEDINNSLHSKTIERLLRGQDYLAIDSPGKAELTITGKGSKLAMRTKEALPLDVSVNEFISAPQSLLEKVSQRGDAQKFFRTTIFFSLLFGFPVMLYALLYAILYGSIAKLTSSSTAAAITSMLCFVAGMSLFWPVWQSKISPDATADLSAALASDQWRIRVAALQKICTENVGISKYSGYNRSIASAHISERYWLARAIALDKNPQSYADLLKLAQDSHPNVRCQAFYGLGKRDQRNAIPFIYDAIKRSDHWYIQWYGYRALRRLGWMQPQSNQKRF